MRIIQAVVFLALLLAIAVFAVQNTAPITVNFLSWNVTQSVALVIVAVYILGMLSGWSFLAFMRGSLRKVSERPGH